MTSNPILLIVPFSISRALYAGLPSILISLAAASFSSVSTKFFANVLYFFM